MTGFLLRGKPTHSTTHVILTLTLTLLEIPLCNATKNVPVFE